MGVRGVKVKGGYFVDFSAFKDHSLAFGVNII